MVEIKYIPATDTLVIRLDELASIVRSVELDFDVEIGISNDGHIVEIRISRASRYGLLNIVKMLRRAGIVPSINGFSLRRIR